MNVCALCKNSTLAVVVKYSLSLLANMNGTLSDLQESFFVYNPQQAQEKLFGWRTTSCCWPETNNNFNSNFICLVIFIQVEAQKALEKTNKIIIKNVSYRSI